MSNEDDDFQAKVSCYEVAFAPDEQYDLVKACSMGACLEVFARGARSGWAVRGNQAGETYAPMWKAYSYNSAYVRD